MTRAAEVPPNDEIAREPDHVRRAVLGAIQRLMLGQPQRVRPGASSISDLAREADVSRHHLYQTHPDLKARFEYLRDRAQTPSVVEERLGTDLDKARQEIARLTALQARTHERAENWKALCETLQRAINVLQEELRQEQLTSERLVRRLEAQSSPAPGGPVVPIRARSRR